MDIDRRAFITTIGGTAAAANLIVASACGQRNEAAAAAAQSGSSSPFDPSVLLSRLNADGEFKLGARFWDAKLRLDVGDRIYVLTIREGAVTELVPMTQAAAVDVRIAGSEDGWVGSFESLRGLTVEGDSVTHVWPYHTAIMRIVALLRESLRGPATETIALDVDRQFDTAVGRYVYVRIKGVQYRVYFEETGQGIPIVLQHTAGADGRQWRQLLEDNEIQKRFRMIAYDLPYHGKSLPPTGVKWWTQEYRLTTELLIDSVVAISHALKLERPAYMGCSVGGYLAPDLALYRPEEFRAVIGINSGVGGGRGDREGARASKAGERSQIDAFMSYTHPRVNTNQLAQTIYSHHYSYSPQSPEAYRREIGWVYGQGGPGVFPGDSYYHIIDHDLTGGKARKIDTSKIDVYFLSGEFDTTYTGNGLKDLVAQVPGATRTVIKGGSHFAMADNYPAFREALIPVLDRIHAKSVQRSTSSRG